MQKSFGAYRRGKNVITSTNGMCKSTKVINTRSEDLQANLGCDLCGSEEFLSFSLLMGVNIETTDLLSP